jgi:hypothetical protein
MTTSRATKIEIEQAKESRIVEMWKLAWIESQ